MKMYHGSYRQGSWKKPQEEQLPPGEPMDIDVWKVGTTERKPCPICGKIGHGGRYCRNKESDRSCFNCGKDGHISVKCPKRASTSTDTRKGNGDPRKERTKQTRNIEETATVDEEAEERIN